MVLIRKLLSLLALLSCVVILATPSTARSAHDLEHVQVPIADGQFHVHDTVGSGVQTLVSQEEPMKTQDPREGKTGHSHMPSSAFDLGFLPIEELQPRALSNSDALSLANTPALGTLGWSPPIRPPRTA